MTEWRKHTGTERPSELAAAQLILVTTPDPEFGISVRQRADKANWWATILWKPALTEDGLPYVSAEGLDDAQDPKHVITETDGRVTALEEDWPPYWNETYQRWSVGPQPRRPAPDTHAIPGDPANSLAVVWRE